MEQMSTCGTREEALALHRAGRLDAARTAYEALLTENAADRDVLGLLGVLAFQDGRLDEAEALLVRSIGEPADPRICLRNLNNLIVLLRETGRDDEAQARLSGDSPDWPEETPATQAERGSVLSLVEALLLYEQTAKARRLLDRALPERDADAAALSLDGQLLLAEGDADGVAAALERAAALMPDDPLPLIMLGHAQRKLGRTAEARETVHRVARGWPVYSAPASARQRATILVLNPAPHEVKDPNKGLMALHFSANYPSQIASQMHDEYRFHSLFADLAPDELPQDLPAADLVLNNIVNAEKLNAPGRLERVRAVVDRLGLPVINHPDAVFRITRQKLALLLDGIPNLRVPHIARYRREPGLLEWIADDIAARVGLPVIVRQTGAHMSSDSQLIEEGKVAERLSDRAALLGFLKHMDWTEFYAIEFLDLKRPDGFYRKLRAVIVENEVIITQAAMHWRWAVTGWRSRPEGIDFYRAHPQVQQECVRICQNPEAELGNAAMRTLRDIGDRVPLDYFGIDFDVDSGGRVAFFEATPAMTIGARRSQQPEDIRLPPEPVQGVDDAFRRMIARRIAAKG